MWGSVVLQGFCRKKNIFFPWFCWPLGYYWEWFLATNLKLRKLRMLKVGWFFTRSHSWVSGPGFCPWCVSHPIQAFNRTGTNTHGHTRMMGLGGWDTAETLGDSMNLSSKQTIRELGQECLGGQTLRWRCEGQTEARRMRWHWCWRCPEPHGGRQGGAVSHHLSQEPRGWQEAVLWCSGPGSHLSAEAKAGIKGARGQSTSIHSSPEVLTDPVLLVLWWVSTGKEIGPWGPWSVLLERDKAWKDERS